ncbi:MAG: acyl-CoA thioesterase [Sandaracinobacteroides sp.]
MALKDEAWRLDAASYPVRQTLQTRFGDMDANAHLNNVAIARLFEETRVLTLSRLRDGAASGDPSSMMIAHVGIDYLAEGRYPDDVAAGLAVAGIGRTSFRLALALFQAGGPIAIADCAMVNLAEGRPAVIGDGLRAKLEEMRNG